MNSGLLFERSTAGAPCSVTSSGGWSGRRLAGGERPTSPPMHSRVCSSMMEQILIAWSCSLGACQVVCVSGRRLGGWGSRVMRSGGGEWELLEGFDPVREDLGFDQAALGFAFRAAV